MHTRHRERGSRRRKLCSSEEDAFSRLVECDSPPWPTDCRPKASSSTRPSPRPLPPSPLPLFLTASCIQLWLNFGREYSESMPLCVYVYYSRIPLLESIALEIVSRWYRIDASGAVEREGGKVLDGCGFRCYRWIWNREGRARIRRRKLIFEYLEIDFDIYRREFWIIVIAWYR